MKKICIIALMIIITHISWGQETSIQSNIEGIWEFQSANSESKNCEAPTPFPIKELHLKDDVFTMISLNDTIIGNYKFVENELRMSRIINKGEPKTKEEKLTVKSIQDEQLIIELPFECGLLNLNYKKRI